MRKAVLIFAALATLAFAVGGMTEKWRTTAVEAAAPGPAPAVELPLAGSSEPVAATPAAFVAAAPAVPEPPKDPGADLPVVQVTQPPVHAVPDNAGMEQAPAVSFRSLDGRPVERTAFAPPAPRTRSRSVALEPPLPFAGKAKAGDGASLSVDGRPVRLFGVRAPGPHDRCSDGGANCGEAARTALAQRLAGNPGVTCVLPPGQEGDPAYVCHDSTGVDLGRLLVVEGLALADTARSYEYLGAQDGARSARQGLWRYR